MDCFPALEELIKWAKDCPPPTPEERREQTVSFVWGNLAIDEPTVTREEVELAYDNLHPSEKLQLGKFKDPKFIGKSWDATTGIIMNDSDHPELIGKPVTEWSEGVQIQMGVIEKEST